MAKNDAIRIITMPATAAPVNAGPAQMTLDDVEAGIGAGEAMLECPWESFRRRNFPGRDHDAAAALLGKWALSRRIEAEFDYRRSERGGQDEIYVLFLPADPLFWPRLLQATADSD
jgi:hypothetical protein